MERNRDNHEELPMEQQVKIVLTPEKFDEFVELCNRPVSDFPRLRDNLQRKSPWA